MREYIARILKNLREESGYTAEEIGMKIGKSGKTVNAWENNRGQPDIETFLNLCEIYGVHNISKTFNPKNTSREIKESISLDETFGSFIKNKRKQLNLTVEEVASFIGKDKATLYRYESGETPNIPYSTVKKLVTILKIDEYAILRLLAPNNSATDDVTVDVNLFCKSLGCEYCNVESVITEKDFDKVQLLSNEQLKSLINCFKTILLTLVNE